MSYPDGPFPDTTEFESKLAETIRDVGVANLTVKVLRQRMEVIYNLNLVPHKDALMASMQNVMAQTEFQKQLAQVNKAKEEGLVARGKGSKGASKSKESKEKKSKEPKEKKTRVEKSKKPDNYPKAPLSSYFMFANEKRPALMAELNSVTLVGKQIGVLWKELSETDKAKFEDLAKKDKARFESEMEAYKAAGGEVVSRSSKSSKTSKSGKPKKAKKEKDPNAPKKPLTAFFMFANEKRADLMAELKSVTLVGKQIGVLWKELSETDKAKYEALAAADKDRYVKECAEKGYPVGGSSTKKSSTGSKKKEKRARSNSSSSSSSSSSSDSSSSSSSSSSDSDSSSSSSSSDSD